jgi:hypothetical protein
LDASPDPCPGAAPLISPARLLATRGAAAKIEVAKIQARPIDVRLEADALGDGGALQQNRRERDGEKKAARHARNPAEVS